MERGVRVDPGDREGGPRFPDRRNRLQRPDDRPPVRRQAGPSDPPRPPLLRSALGAAVRFPALDRSTRASSYRITGHRASASYSVEKLMWVKRHEPEVYAQTYKMMVLRFLAKVV